MKEKLENLSKTSYRPEFRENFSSFENDVKQGISEAVLELVNDYLTNPWNHENVKFLPSEGDVWRLKVGNRGEKVDHRVFFDVDSDGIVFLTVKHRDNAYN